MPSFDIAPKYLWNDTDGKAPARKADIYVFCLHNHKNKETANPLQIEQWSFYVVATQTINDVFGQQKRLSLGRLEKINKVVSLRYDELCSAIDKVCKDL